MHLPEDANVPVHSSAFNGTMTRLNLGASVTTRLVKMLCKMNMLIVLKHHTSKFKTLADF